MTDRVLTVNNVFAIYIKYLHSFSVFALGPDILCQHVGKSVDH